MSVYKETENMLRQSIESILGQTMDDFEFIIVLDCPNYEGNAIVEAYAAKDSRIYIIRNKENIGLTLSLNEGLKRAKGKYIARMDADDISEPRRFEVQNIYMEQHPDVAVAGAYIDGFDEKGKHIIGQNNCTDDAEKTRIRMLFCNAGVTHSTAFIRKSFLDENKITYDINMKKSQDYGLWTDIVMNGGIIKVIPEVLVRYRIHSKQITNVNSDEQRICFVYNIKKQLNQYFDMLLDEKEAQIHYSLYHFDPQIDIKDYEKYIEKLIEQNRIHNCFNEDLFLTEIQYLMQKDVMKGLVRYRSFSFLKTKYLICGRALKSIIQQKKMDNQYKKILAKYIEENKVD